MSEITIGPPQTDDSEELATLWVRLAESQRAHGSNLLPEANRMQIREAIVRHIVNDALVVAREENIVGFVMFTLESGGYEQSVRRGLIENLFVEPAYRNQGLGSQLLTAAESRLTDKGAESIALEVMAANDAARRFYREHGYEPHRVELQKPTESDTHSKGDD